MHHRISKLENSLKVNPHIRLCLLNVECEMKTKKGTRKKLKVCEM